MAFELIAAIKGTKEGIGLIAEVVKIAKELRNKDDTSDLQTLLDHLKVAAGSSTRALDFAVRDIRDVLGTLNLPLDKSLGELINNTSWYRWPEKFRLSRLSKVVRSLEDEIHRIMGDVTALLICSGQMEGAGGAYTNGFQSGADMLASAPLGMPLDDLLRHFDKLVKGLEAQVREL